VSHCSDISPFSCKNQNGIALIVTLMVIAILTVLVLEFAFSTRINLYITSNLADGTKAYFLAKSGVQVAAGAMLDDIQNSSEDYLQEDWAQQLPPIPAGNGWVTVEITDEDSKFCLNRLIDKRGKLVQSSVKILESLCTQLEIPVEVAYAIEDWVDADNDLRPNGGDETSMWAYNTLPVPYAAKNGYFSSLMELRLIWGMTDDYYKKLSEVVTVYGDSKMNINTVDRKVLLAVLEANNLGDKEDSVDQIVQWREANYFEAKNFRRQLRSDLNLDPAVIRVILKNFTVLSHFFSTKSTAQVNETTKIATGVIFRTKAKVRVIYFRTN